MLPFQGRPLLYLERHGWRNNNKFQAWVQLTKTLTAETFSSISCFCCTTIAHWLWRELVTRLPVMWVNLTTSGASCDDEPCLINCFGMPSAGMEQLWRVWCFCPHCHHWLLCGNARVNGHEMVSAACVEQDNAVTHSRCSVASHMMSYNAMPVARSVG